MRCTAHLNMDECRWYPTDCYNCDFNPDSYSSSECCNVPNEDYDSCRNCDFFSQCMRDWIAETNEEYENDERE